MMTKYSMDMAGHEMDMVMTQLLHIKSEVLDTIFDKIQPILIYWVSYVLPWTHQY